MNFGKLEIFQTRGNVEEVRLSKDIKVNNSVRTGMIKGRRSLRKTFKNLISEISFTAILNSVAILIYSFGPKSIKIAINNIKKTFSHTKRHLPSYYYC
jgi:hypothetical protein